jgi:hypothetical protein
MYVHKRLKQVADGPGVVTLQVTEEYESWYTYSWQIFTISLALIIVGPILLFSLPVFLVYYFLSTMRFHLLGGTHPGKIVKIEEKVLQPEDE